jgi:hypothetical protein
MGLPVHFGTVEDTESCKTSVVGQCFFLWKQLPAEHESRKSEKGQKNWNVFLLGILQGGMMERHSQRWVSLQPSNKACDDRVPEDQRKNGLIYANNFDYL